MKRSARIQLVYLTYAMQTAGLLIVLEACLPTRIRLRDLLVVVLCAVWLGVVKGITYGLILARVRAGQPLFPWWGRNDDDQ